MKRNKINKKKKFFNSIKFSVKLNGISTSFTVNKGLVVLYVVLSSTEEELVCLVEAMNMRNREFVRNFYRNAMSDFIYEQIPKIENIGTGSLSVSDYVSQSLFKEILDKNDYKLFRRSCKII